VSTTAATAIRLAWDQLPAPLRDGLDTRLGGITAARTQTGGFTPGLAVRLQLTDGSRLFAKGIPASHVLAWKYSDEAAACRQLPPAAPAPRLRWDGQIAGWIVLIFDDIDGRHPALAPGSPDISRVVAMTAGLAALLTPCPVAAAPPPPANWPGWSTAGANWPLNRRPAWTAGPAATSPAWPNWKPAG
jgi:hypothetical protein